MLLFPGELVSLLLHNSFDFIGDTRYLNLLLMNRCQLVYAILFNATNFTL